MTYERRSSDPHKLSKKKHTHKNCPSLFFHKPGPGRVWVNPKRIWHMSDPDTSYYQVSLCFKGCMLIDTLDIQVKLKFQISTARKQEKNLIYTEVVMINRKKVLRGTDTSMKWEVDGVWNPRACLRVRFYFSWVFFNYSVLPICYYVMKIAPTMRVGRWFLPPWDLLGGEGVSALVDLWWELPFHSSCFRCSFF